MDTTLETLELPTETVTVNSWKEDSLAPKKGLSVSMRRRLWIVGGVYALVSAVGAVLFHFFRGHFSFFTFLTFAYPLAFLVLMLDRETEPLEEQLREELDDPLAQVVSISIFQNEVLTGQDRGVLSIIDDTVVFVGRRCTFSIGFQHLAEETRNWKSKIAGDGVRSLSLKLQHPTHSVWILVTVLRTKGWTKSAQSELIRQLTMFSSYRRPSENPGVYPPLSSDPQMPLEKTSVRNLKTRTTAPWKLK